MFITAHHQDVDQAMVVHVPREKQQTVADLGCIVQQPGNYKHNKILITAHAQVLPSDSWP